MRDTCNKIWEDIEFELKVFSPCNYNKWNVNWHQSIFAEYGQIIEKTVLKTAIKVNFGKNGVKIFPKTPVKRPEDLSDQIFWSLYALDIWRFFSLGGLVAKKIIGIILLQVSRRKLSKGNPGLHLKTKFKKCLDSNHKNP